MRKSITLRILILVFFPFTCGYFFTAFFNQVNAVAAPYFNQSIAMSPSQMGLMTSVYLLSFSLFQLPLGILLDRFGAKRVQVVLFVIASLGICIFSHAHSYRGLLLGRAIIGLGLAAGLMAGFKAMRQWFPAQRIPLCNACMMAFGSIGALFSTAPTAYLLTHMSWRSLLNDVAIAALFTAALIFFLVIEKPRTNIKTLKIKELAGALKHIYSSTYFWRIAPICALIFAMNMTMVGLWAGQWFRHVSMYSSISASHHLMVIAISLIIGILINGLIADSITNRFNQPITLVMGVGFLLFIIIEVLIISTPLSGSYIAWFLFGFFGRNVTLGYAAISQHFPSSYAGRSVTALNMLYFLTAFVMQFAFGAMIDLWPKTPVSAYPITAYQTAFAFMVGLQIISLLWFVWFNKHQPNKLQPNGFVE